MATSITICGHENAWLIILPIWERDYIHDFYAEGVCIEFRLNVSNPLTAYEENEWTWNEIVCVNMIYQF